MRETRRESRYYVVAIIGKYGADVVAGPFDGRAAAAEVCERPGARPAGAPPPAVAYEVVGDAQVRTAGERGLLCRW